MHKRFWIICSVIAMGLGVLSALGLSSLGMHEKGLRAERQQEFIAVAEKVRFDVKKKLDAFLLAEQRRPYTDYQYYYVPMAHNQAAALVRSPLGDSISNDLAYGYFQLDSTAQITNPYAPTAGRASAEVKNYLENLSRNLLPSLGNGESMQVARIEPSERKEEYDDDDAGGISSRLYDRRKSAFTKAVERPAAEENEKGLVQAPAETPVPTQGKKIASKSKSDAQRRSRYSIDLEENQQMMQVVSRSRDNVGLNLSNNAMVQNGPEGVDQAPVGSEMFDKRPQQQAGFDGQRQPVDIQPPPAEDLVQVRIEPFVPITVAGDNGDSGIFAGQVFLLRHVQIEDNHLLQGFRLDEPELISQVGDSAQKFIRRGMGFDISKAELPEAAYTAVLDFGFGEVVLNLLEQQPGWITSRVVQIRNWFFAILAVVWLAVIVALGAFGRNMYEQVQLSRKKDDFISAVSHELRTPLTSIRMYTEMLEKDWVKTDEKRREYYTTMRQESERLTRLIENVLDFSRIQRGKKRYEFTVGDVNACIGEVVEMMRPYADRAGFTLLTEFAELESFSFDRDAVVQIVINLLDNALKYAKEAGDKFILIRTARQKDYVVIEVEDHGPGIARSQQKKIFEAFYRCGDESTRQATGTGLGLALVKRFAEAHHGFVEIINTKPTGALFRVGLANHYGH